MDTEIQRVLVELAHDADCWPVFAHIVCSNACKKYWDDLKFMRYILYHPEFEFFFMANIRDPGIQTVYSLVKDL